MLVTFSDKLTEAGNRAALAFRARLDSENLAFVQETSTSLTSVYVGFEPAEISHTEMAALLNSRLACEDWFASALPSNRKLWRIPTAYGGQYGPQLAEAAKLANISAEQAIDQISTQKVRVMTIGFAPGQPYLGQLPAQWDIPRRTELVPNVPVGALVTAIQQLVLFTAQTPTGWRHIGQTGFQGFRAECDQPFLLSAGDEVIFYSVDHKFFAEIVSENQQGDGGAVWEKIQ